MGYGMREFSVFFLSPVQETSELTFDYNHDLLDSRKLKYIELYCTQIDYSQHEISGCKLFYAVHSLRTLNTRKHFVFFCLFLVEVYLYTYENAAIWLAGLYMKAIIVRNGLHRQN